MFLSNKMFNKSVCEWTKLSVKSFRVYREIKCESLAAEVEISCSQTEENKSSERYGLLNSRHLIFTEDIFTFRSHRLIFQSVNEQQLNNLTCASVH